MLTSRYSILEISRVIETQGSMPVVVMAEDLEDYVCKYDFKSKLINEYLAWKFLEAWELPTIPAAFVNIKAEHVKAEYLCNRMQRSHFNKPTFGLRYYNDASDVNNLLLGLRNDYHELGKFTNRADVLKIALFDLWIANTDRNHNNYNLLIVPSMEGYQICPIDHSEIFDGGRIGQELAQLTAYDSILSSDLAKILIPNKKKAGKVANDLLTNFHTFVDECGKLLHEAVVGLPNEWCDDKELLEKQVTEGVIENKAWLDDTTQNFIELFECLIR